MNAVTAAGDRVERSQLTVATMGQPFRLLGLLRRHILLCQGGDGMAEPVEMVRELFAAVAVGDRDAIAARLAPEVRWQGRERGPRWRRRRPSCSGAEDATASMLLIGRKLPTIEPRAFQAAGDRVLVGLWADTMEGRPTRWWSVLTVRAGRVTAIQDYRRHRDAIRTLPPKVETAP